MAVFFHRAWWCWIYNTAVASINMRYSTRLRLVDKFHFLLTRDGMHNIRALQCPSSMLTIRYVLQENASSEICQSFQIMCEVPAFLNNQNCLKLIFIFLKTSFGCLKLNFTHTK